MSHSRIPILGGYRSKYIPASFKLTSRYFSTVFSPWVQMNALDYSDVLILYTVLGVKSTFVVMHYITSVALCATLRVYN